VQIDWQRLMAKRDLVLDNVNAMPTYVLKPEVLGLLGAEKYPTYRLILDLMWTTGARIPEVLALTSSHLIDDGYNFMVVLRALKQRSVRPTHVQRAGSAKRAEPSLS
jgi:site-specific recombinase XerD